MQQHTTALHSLPLNSKVMWRLMTLAKGWGSKGSGLGLFACVTTDDSREGQGALPKYAGEVSFECYQSTLDSIAREITAESGNDTGVTATSGLISVHIPMEEMLAPSPSQEQQAEKRRKTGKSAQDRRLPASGTSFRSAKSTAELFYHSLDKIEESGHSRDQIPPEKRFFLLSDVRLARSFHTCTSRVEAVERRLRALICILHSHPSQESISDYFLAQPELCSELVDLVRPTVSSSSLSSCTVANGAGSGDKKDGDASRQNSILALADSPVVPYNIRTLAIEALTALVARRDTTGTLTNVARQVGVLSELGVGKGQYLGLLPTLIRYSLAALNSFLLHDGADTSQSLGNSTVETHNNEDGSGNSVAATTPKDIGLELGLTFLKSTKPPPLPQTDREERALEFIDAVLTLTSAVVSVPSGTAALTDCGIIPALVSTIALDSQIAQKTTIHESPFYDASKGSSEESYSDCLLKFISAQAIQILEGAIVTHNNALAAFHELHGVDILVQRLNVEVKKVHSSPPSISEEKDSDVTMEDAGVPPTGESTKTNESTSISKSRSRHNLQAARRVLLFSAVNCLTVVFHQHETGAVGSVVPSGGAQLRKPELLHVLMDIMDNVDSYGGVLAALVATLLSDVMNADPQVVHHVHKSGLAKSFLAMLLGKDNETTTLIGENVEAWGEPIMEPSAELIMALPNVISALSLTENGVKAIAEANPFSALLSVFCSPKYAMPNSRCLLNEMAAIVGTGLGEIMMHNPSLRPVVLKSVVQVMKRVAFIGKNLSKQEEERDSLDPTIASLENENTESGAEINMETARTHLMQYGYNISQVLEQMLHNEDNIPHFAEAGGFDALLELARWSITPGGRQIVAHVSCLSSPSIANVTHSSTSSTLSSAVKIIAAHYDPHKLIKHISEALDLQLCDLGKCINTLRAGVMSDNEDLACDKMTESIPCVPLHDLEKSIDNSRIINVLSSLFKSIISVDWLVDSLAFVIKAACQRANELGMGLGRSEREWKKEISSKSFQNLLGRLSSLHRSALWEVCRVRTEPSFDNRDLVRSRGSNDQLLVYKIRIVCQEGAIVRNGIDIDDCENVGNLEMGEIVEAFDRCINSSGVLRYQTSRGWVSEQTRGHGREQIAEIIDLRADAGTRSCLTGDKSQKKMKRIECGIPDLKSVCASIMARLHASHTHLFSSLERLMVSGIRSLPLRERTSFQQNGIGSHVTSVAHILSTNLKKDFEFAEKKTELDDDSADDTTSKISKDASKCMFYGNILNLLHTCLYEEKRERRILNIPLLLNLMASNGWKDGIYPPEIDTDDKNAISDTPECGFLLAIQFVLRHSLRDMAIFAVKERTMREEQSDKIPADGVSQCSLHQRVSRAVASSLPPTLSLLRRLISRPLFFESQMSNVLTKMKSSDLASLMSELPTPGELTVAETPVFNAGRFTRALHLKLAEMSFEMWSDERFSSAPAHIVYPWMTLMGEIISSLEEAGKFKPIISSSRETSNTSRTMSPLDDLSDSHHRLARNLSTMGVLLGRSGARSIERSSEPFEPSETAIARLGEMGFSRDHAVESLESTGTNRVDVAMEYALTHPPSSPATRERRRAAREERRIQRGRLLSSMSNATVNGGDNVVEGETAGNEERPRPEASSTTDQSTDPLPSSDAPNNSDETKPDALTEDELKVQQENEMEKKLAARAQQYLESMRESMTRISLNIIEGGSVAEKHREDSNTMETTGQLDDGSGAGDGDSEGVTVVMCNFLLDLCTRYPADITKISSELLIQLKSNLHVESPSHCRVKMGCEANFAALAHTSVIFFRALPKSRPLVLRYGIVGCLLHCVRNITLTSALRSGKDSSIAPMVWPKWLAPALLLLEVMAQPTAVSLEDNEEEEEAGVSKSSSKKGEFGRVMAEHKKQASMLARTTKHVFSAVSKEDGLVSTKKKKGKDSTESKKKIEDPPASNNMESSQDTQKGAQPVPITSIPPFLPLILPETAEACMLLCLQLLGLRSKKGLDKAHLAKVCPPPGIVHAVFVLLIRVLHSQKLVSTCLQMGGADLVLALPSCCHFEGNSGLVTLLLRRLLEDEATLQTMMETEIRSQVAKLWKKQRRGASSEGERPKANLKPFMQAVTHIICRDPTVFLKAFASSVKLEPARPESSSNDSQIVLLSTEERVKNSKLLNSLSVNGNTTTTVFTPNAKKGEDDQAKRGRSCQKDKSYVSKSGRSKSPYRASIIKRGMSPKSTPQTKKEKQEGQWGSAHKHSKKHVQLDGTPANHVASLLLKEIMNTAPRDDIDSTSDEQPFLTTPDHLDILSDLVLAIPACAAAIHRFKPTCCILNAVSGCHEPPQTAVGFLLHNLLSQPRSILHPKSTSKHADNLDKETKKAVVKSRTSQSAARLIVCLVARSGEGRRRVISDLVFALSCGQCPNEHKCGSSQQIDSVNHNPLNEEIEMWALQTWGELCIGLAAPRSNNANQDSNSLLSFEVVRIMLDYGVAHALMFAVERLKLYHPMASTVAGALVRPLEIFTRGSVFKTVQDMFEKDCVKIKPEVSRLHKESRRNTFGPSQRSESAFADDAMLEDGFDAETAEIHARLVARRNFDDIIVGNARGDGDFDDIDGDDDDDGDEVDSEDDSMNDDIDESDSDEDEESSDEDDEIEVRLGNVDYSDPDNIGSDDDEEISSGSSNDEDSDEVDSAVDESDEEMDDGSENDEHDGDEGALFIDGDEEEVIDGEEGWARENDDFFEGNAANDGNNDLEGVLGENEMEDGMEGWTRVEGQGFGNMLLDVMRPHVTGGHSNRQRNGMMQAAEAMLGNILRAGDVQIDSLSEIEESLGMHGIRIVRDRRDGRSGIGINMGQNINRPLGGDRSGSSAGPASTTVGAVPTVNQSVPPDVYNLTGLSGNRSLVDLNPMEYIFGGPASGAGSQCYDLTFSGRNQRRDQSIIPASFDTQLFPGGIAASIHRAQAQQQPLHPLLCGVELPPVNSMVSTLSSTGQSASAVERNSGAISSTGTYVAGPNGNIIRVHGRPPNASGVDQLRGRSSTSNFDGSLIDRTTEEFSASFGQALNAVFSQENSLVQTTQSNDGNSTSEANPAGNNVASNENSHQTSSSTHDNRTATSATELEESVRPNEHVEVAATASNETAPAPRSTSAETGTRDGGENDANVATSLAAGLTISQPTPDNALILPNSQLPNESPITDSNADGGCAEGNESAAGNEVMVEGHGREESAENEVVVSSEAHQAESSQTPPTMESTQDVPNVDQPGDTGQSNAENVLSCPPNVDLEVFNSLPYEMQQEIIEQHDATNAVAAEIGETSGLDPEALAALPEEMRREIIEQEQQQQRLREQPAADPANAEDMDNASFLASLAPDLRADILLQADDTFLNSLPADIIAEAQIIRERATTQQRRRVEETTTAAHIFPGARARAPAQPQNAPQEGHAGNSSRGRRVRNGKLSVETNRPGIVYIPGSVVETLGPLLTSNSTKALIRLLYLLSPIQPQRVLQKLFLNICLHAESRKIFLNAFTALLNDDKAGVTEIVDMIQGDSKGDQCKPEVSQPNDMFPPCTLIGTAPDIFEASAPSHGMFRRRHGGNSAAAVAASLPASARGSCHDESIPPVVARRIVSYLSYLSKSPRVCVSMLSIDGTDSTENSLCEDRHNVSSLERLLDLLQFNLYSKSATNLEQLLNLLESVVAPLSLLPKDTDAEVDLSTERSSIGKEWIKVPKVVVSKRRLHLLCSVLRHESCKESSFMKVNTLTRRLSRIEANRECILGELALVAQGLGADAIRDIKSISIRLSAAAKLHQEKLQMSKSEANSVMPTSASNSTSDNDFVASAPSSAVSLSTSSSELKLLRVLQTLHSLCGEYTQEETAKSDEGNSPEFVALLQNLDLESLWDELSTCLRTVSVLEGVAQTEDLEDSELDNDGNDSDAEKDAANGKSGKKLQNSVAGLITRFLPAIEAFFMVSATATTEEVGPDSSDANASKDRNRLVQFVANNKVLLNALLRSNPHLLEKGLKAMVQIPKCRPFLDFDVKRQWFKTQVRRLRQQASRRHGSLRLNLRRKYVFEDAFHAFIHRNAEELRGRLHITFQNEEGVDAGGLSREFFAILAKEMFNPNYALFMSTEDGCTFQPNPNSSINPDDLRYFRFVGRIVGKAVVDGFLLDAHFTRSLYKHMLGIKVCMVLVVFQNHFTKQLESHISLNSIIANTSRHASN